MDALFEQFFQGALAELQTRQRRAYDALRRPIMHALPVGEALAAVDKAVQSRSSSKAALAPTRVYLAMAERHATAQAEFAEALDTTYAEAVRTVCGWVWDAGGRDFPAEARDIVVTLPELNRLADLVAALRKGGKGGTIDAADAADAVGKAMQDEVAEYTRRKAPTFQRPRAKPKRRAQPGTKKDRDLFDRRLLGIPTLARQDVQPDETIEQAEIRVRKTIARGYKRRERKRKQLEQERREHAQ